MKRLIDAILLEQNDEWRLQRRYTAFATMKPLSEDTIPPSTTVPA